MHLAPRVSGSTSPRHDLRASAARRRSLENLFRMGHCAPSVLQTLLDLAGDDAPWLVKLVGGLPGGIGNGGNECGGITAPLVVLGLRHARAPDVDGVPVVVLKGRALLREFQAAHGSTACRDILGHAHLPLRCMHVVEHAAERCLAVDGRRCDEELPADARAACARLHAHLSEHGFHCAHAVLRAARQPGPVEPRLLDATAGFVGGTACAGLTCSSLTAGVMLLGLAWAELEGSRRRVVRMLATMAVGGDALADGLNGFNRAMNQGHVLVRWFAEQFGSTRCAEITGCDLSGLAGVREYVATGGVGRCELLARAVAARARELMAGRPAPAS